MSPIDLIISLAKQSSLTNTSTMFLKIWGSTEKSCKLPFSILCYSRGAWALLNVLTVGHHSKFKKFAEGKCILNTTLLEMRHCAWIPLLLPDNGKYTVTIFTFDATFFSTEFMFSDDQHHCPLTLLVQVSLSLYMCWKTRRSFEHMTLSGICKAAGNYTQALRTSLILSRMKNCKRLFEIWILTLKSKKIWLWSSVFWIWMLLHLNLQADLISDLFGNLITGRGLYPVWCIIMLAFYYWSIFMLSSNLTVRFMICCFGNVARCNLRINTEKRINFIFSLKYRVELI